ncbi:MAG: cytochrome c-type biogenesis protein [Pseudomonadota bacterium]
MRVLGFIAMLLLALPALQPAWALNPDERLADPVLEQRARDLSKELRCLVCQNQSIDGSDAELARDLRVLVRERLTEGDTNAQVLDYVVARYGEWVLLKPRLGGHTLLLWVLPGLLLIAGASMGRSLFRSKADETVAAELSEDEKQALDRLRG